MHCCFMAASVSTSAADLRGQETFVKRAVALREKYRARDVAGNADRAISPEAVAPHLCNRNGVRMNGQRCKELFLQVFQEFEYREVCQGAVCVEVQSAKG